MVKFKKTIKKFKLKYVEERKGSKKY